MGDAKTFLIVALATAARVLNGEIGVSIRNALGVSGVEVDLTDRIEAKLKELFGGEANESRQTTEDDARSNNGRSRRNRNDVPVSGQ